MVDFIYFEPTKIEPYVGPRVPSGPRVPTSEGSTVRRLREGGKEAAAMVLSSLSSSRWSASSSRGRGGREMERLWAPMPYRVGLYD